MRVKLGEVCEKKTSRYAQKDLVEVDGIYPVYGASGLIKYIDRYDQENEYVAVVKDGAGVGRTMLLPAQSSIIGTLQYILPKTGVCSKYLYYAIKNMHLEKYYTGATVPHIYFKDYQNEEFNLPDENHQREVICVLDILENLISCKAEQIQRLDELIKARFVEMFGDPENNYKAWPVKPLDKLCAVSSSKRVYQSEQISEGVPFWRISDLVSKIDTGTVNNALFISEIKYTELKRAGLVPVTGDILVTSRGTLGRCYIIKDEDSFYFQDGMISWLSNYSEEITPLYLQYLFTMSGFKKQIDNMQAGSTVAYLSIAMLKKLQVMVPDKAMQKQFAAFVAQVDKSKVMH